MTNETIGLILMGITLALNLVFFLFIYPNLGKKKNKQRKIAENKETSGIITGINPDLNI